MSYSLRQTLCSFAVLSIMMPSAFAAVAASTSDSQVAAAETGFESKNTPSIAPEIKQLATIVVSASGFEQNIKKAPASISVLG